MISPAESWAEFERIGKCRDPMMTELERLLVSDEGFGLSTATPVQRAFCRIADGLPLGELATHADVAEALGCDPARLANVRPAELALFSGVRTGKSLIVAALAIRASQTIDVSQLGDGEIPRVSVLSLRRDLADVILDHIRGRLAKPRFARLLMHPPTADTIMLRHPSGRPVEIVVTAGARAGSAVVARWSAGVLLDEAPRMVGAADGVINLDDVVHAARGRMLPGAQIVYLGSPWAPFGPAFDMVQTRHGKPGADLVVMHVRANALNPIWWTEERCEALREKDPVAYRTDVLAEFADSVCGMFESDALTRCARPGIADLAPAPECHYYAATDPATRANAWTLVIAHRDAHDRLVIDIARQWRAGSTPLSPDATLAEIAEWARAYRVSTVYSDQYSGDALRDLGWRHKINISPIAWTATNKVQSYDALRRLVDDGAIELPNDPVLLADLRRVQRRTTQAGVAIDLPRTPDGRHCDYAPALAMLANQRMVAPQEAAEKAAPEDEYLARLDAQIAGHDDRRWWRNGR